MAYNNDEWVGYDDVESMKIKAKYIVDNNLAGAMFWAIDIDDFNGNHCNQGKSPLLNSVRTYFNENKSRQTNSQMGTQDVPRVTAPFQTQLPKHVLDDFINKEFEQKISANVLVDEFKERFVEEKRQKALTASILKSGV